MNSVRELIEQNRSGASKGLPSFCTANEHVINAILSFGVRSEAPLLIEATCNQVNQDGGYTGLTPETYRDWLISLAASRKVPAERLILGGDHLGPNPWRKQSAAVAMDKARQLVRQFAEAGYSKIHLDASMPLGGESQLSFETVAERAADLCEIVEQYAPNPEKVIYVVGTEVPVPGGETEEPDALDVTSVERLQKTIRTHRESFATRGLHDAWSRVVSVVTQPGVDFGHTSVYQFNAPAVAPLRESILGEPGLTFEAHSTDYQSTSALRSLVENQFFFLKVGPELTFRFREAVLGLARLENELCLSAPSDLEANLLAAMANQPSHWADYYRARDRELTLLQLYSYSDRVRYYWNFPEVQAALDRLLSNLTATQIPDGLISQYFGDLPFGDLDPNPAHLVERHILKSVERYMAACGFPPSR